MRTIGFTFAMCLCVSAAGLGSESNAVVEVRDGKSVITGKFLARSKDRATLLDRTGKLHDVTLSKSVVNPMSGSFQPLPVMELRNQLTKEFGKDVELGATRHYIVVGPRGRAANYASVFEDQYVTLQRYLKLRGFTLNEPAFPLVAIVFPSRQKFVEYAQADQANTMTGMLGYYSPRTNRVALFESRDKSVAELSPPHECQHGESTLQFPGLRPNESLTSMLGLHGSSQGDLKSTIVHEATHQVAYNFGLHSRLGEMPRWVVEGIATVFESEGIRDSSVGRDAKQRINRERYIAFQNYAKSRRSPKSLKSFLETDALYDSAVSDFYAQAWAFSFFLVETRPRNYSAYLKRVSARDPFTEYPASERLADFRETVHKDIDWLEIQFLRHIDSLK